MSWWNKKETEYIWNNSQMKGQCPNIQLGSKLVIFLSCVTLKLDGWPWKTTGHLFSAASSFLHHFITIDDYKLELQSGNAQFGSKSAILYRCNLEIWQMTLKNNRTPLLCYFKLCTSFQSHWWIQTRVTVRKSPNWGKICFDLCDLHLCPWPFAWTSLLSMVITPENVMMIWW